MLLVGARWRCRGAYGGPFPRSATVTLADISRRRGSPSAPRHRIRPPPKAPTCGRHLPQPAAGVRRRAQARAISRPAARSARYRARRPRWCSTPGCRAHVQPSEGPIGRHRTGPIEDVTHAQADRGTASTTFRGSYVSTCDGYIIHAPSFRRSWGSGYPRCIRLGDSASNCLPNVPLAQVYLY